MKGFLQKYNYSIVKMFVNQFAISIFGSTLAMATTIAKNKTLTLVVSFCAVIFYLFLLYVMTWEIGSKDRVSVDIGKMEYKPMTGLFLSLFANIPNFIIAILFTIGYPSLAAGGEWGSNLCAVLKAVFFVFEGMYLGIMTVFQIPANGIAQYLNNLWWPYFLITVPALLTCMTAYIFGYKNIHFTSLMVYKDPNQSKKK